MGFKTQNKIMKNPEHYLAGREEGGVPRRRVAALDAGVVRSGSPRHREHLRCGLGAIPGLIGLPSSQTNEIGFPLLFSWVLRRGGRQRRRLVA